LPDPAFLEFKVKLPDGKQETRRVACGREDPLLVFFEKAFKVRFKDDALGPQVIEIEGQCSSYYHFVLIDRQTGKKYMPYAEDGDGRRIYLDLRHILSSQELARNMAVEIFMVYDHRDMDNSVTTRYEGTHAWFKLDEFTGEDLRMGDLSRMMKRHYIGNAGEDYRFHFLQLRARMLSERTVARHCPPPVFSFDGVSFSFSLPVNEQGTPPLTGAGMQGASDPVMVQETGLLPHIAACGGKAPAAGIGWHVLAESHFQASKIDGQRHVQLNAYQSAIAEISAAANNGSEQRGKNDGNRIETKSQKPKLDGIAPSFERSETKARRQRKKTAPAPFSALSSFKAVIFDLDGVIVDSEMVHPRTFEMALAKYGVKIDNAHWKRAYTGIGSYAIFEDLVKKHGIKEDARELVEKRNRIYLEEIRKNRLRVIEGFAKVHRLLGRTGVKEAVASGGHINHVEESMRSAGISGMPFVAIEQVKRGKPDPEIFLKAAKRLRVKPSECIVFEDSLSGVEAAARAGMPCVALSTTMKRRELSGKAALIVNNYKSKKLKRLLSVLLAKRKNSRGNGKKKKARLI